MKRFLKAVALTGALVIAPYAGAASLGDVLGSIAVGEANRIQTQSCDATSYGAVPGPVSGTATISVYDCETGYNQNTGAVTMMADITFNNYSTTPGLSSNGTVRVQVELIGYTSFSYTLDSVNGPIVYTLDGTDHTVEFESYSVSGAMNASYIDDLVFSGGAWVDGQYWAAGADNWGYVWGG